MIRLPAVSLLASSLFTTLSCRAAQVVTLGEDTAQTSTSGTSGATSSTSATPTDTSPTGTTTSIPTSTTTSTDRAPFTLAVLPDTQEYVESYPEIFTEQTAWIADQASEENIAFVLHEGDITDDNNDEQWARADASLSLLDGQVPYILSLGNHDLGPNGDASDRSTDYDLWFPPSRFESEPWYGGHMADRPGDHYAVFTAGGMEFLIISLEFGPDDDMLEWAAEVIAAHPTHRTIILTHCYLSAEDARVGRASGASPHNYGLASLGVNDGDEMWEELVSLHENIFLVLSGHVTGDGAGQLTSEGVAGNPVHQVMANYQHFAKGGTGWLRLMKFHPDEDRIDVRTFSPYLEAAGAEDIKANPEHFFSLDYDMSD